MLRRPGCLFSLNFLIIFLQCQSYFSLIRKLYFLRLESVQVRTEISSVICFIWSPCIKNSSYLSRCFTLFCHLFSPSLESFSCDIAGECKESFTGSFYYWAFLLFHILLFHTYFLSLFHVFLLQLYHFVQVSAVIRWTRGI